MSAAPKPVDSRVEGEKINNLIAHRILDAAAANGWKLHSFSTFFDVFCTLPLDDAAPYSAVMLVFWLYYHKLPSKGATWRSSVVEQAVRKLYASLLNEESCVLGDPHVYLKRFPVTGPFKACQSWDHSDLAHWSHRTCANKAIPGSRAWAPLSGFGSGDGGGGGGGLGHREAREARELDEMFEKMEREATEASALNALFPVVPHAVPAARRARVALALHK